MWHSVSKALVLAALAAASAAAGAQADYPARPIKMVVAWPPGSGIDVFMRQIDEALGKELGQPVIIENKPGAAGAIGAQQVADAQPDGYTLLFSSAAMNMVAAMHTRTPYRMPDSFAPVVNVFSSPMVLVTNPKLGLKSPRDLIALARKEQLFYSTSGIGAPSHFVGELFANRTGIKATSVPTQGSPQAMMEQIAGRVTFHFAVSSTALPPARDGRVQALAVTSRKRLEIAPEIPTLGEYGINIDAAYWNGILGPKGLPAPVADRIADAVNKVLARDDIRARLRSTGNELDGQSDPASFATLIKDDYELWSGVADAASIRAQ